MLQKKNKMFKLLKKKKKVTGIVLIFIIILGCLGWYNYPKLLTYEEKSKIVVDIYNKKGLNKAYSYIDRAFFGKQANQEKVAFAMAIDQSNKQVEVINTSFNKEDYSEYTYIKTLVKNVGKSDVNYIKYNIYYYDGNQGSGNIIGTDWGNSDKPLPVGGITEMDTMVKPPTDCNSYRIEIKEIH